MSQIGQVCEINLEKQQDTTHRLGWKRLTFALVVESVALGSLSLPAAFATLGMVASIICCIGLGLVAIYTGFLVGKVKLRYPHVSHYADSGRLLMGNFGYELFGAMFTLSIVFVIASHVLTGTIAFVNITNSGVCSAIFGFISTLILLILAIPPSFADIAILGYIDFVSILAAIALTMIATGIQASKDSGLLASNWSAWPKPGITFIEAFVAIANIVFAYTFCVGQFSFMDEMHTPRDFMKSIWLLGGLEISIYTLTGAIIYSFVGVDVKSPALLSAGDQISKIAFGIALPVIFISGSINTTVLGRYIHGRFFDKNSPGYYVKTPKGWAVWLTIVTCISFAAFLIAELIPFFNPLLSLLSSLFVSGFCFYLPAIMWYRLLREGSWYARKNIANSLMSLLSFIVGVIVLICGTYASVANIIQLFQEGDIGQVFTCKPVG
ncbi:hypothetical protein CDD81_7792 [Ophiocordyceps australis]|uniref:Amino acid transporter transmembrane domain-containing protein n=1 Tax=Ophiocordyceps australis TaxID=1399860 RepID=A0A2C5Y4I7_9HYPO|nr:hypothetical protein CDD81_7792 [Ophiocordyceps australis]